ncbi:MAG: F0F1 ATP synthase subunit B [bacterium]
MIGLNIAKTGFLILNFLILLYLMRKFFFKPVVEILEDRREKIKEGLAQREIAKKEKEAALKEREEIIAKGRIDSRNIIKEAEKKKEQIIAAAKAEADEIISQGKKSIFQEREKLKEEMNLQLIELVNSAAHSALPTLFKKKDSREMVEDVVLESIRQVSM